MEEEGSRGLQSRQEDGSSPKLAEGPALVTVVRFRVGLPALPLRRFVVNICRRARVAIIWILLHHLELGLNGTYLSARAGEVGGTKKNSERRCWQWGWEETQNWERRRKKYRQYQFYWQVGRITKKLRPTTVFVFKWEKWRSKRDRTAEKIVGLVWERVDEGWVKVEEVEEVRRKKGGEVYESSGGGVSTLYRCGVHTTEAKYAIMSQKTWRILPFYTEVCLLELTVFGWWVFIGIGLHEPSCSAS